MIDEELYKIATEELNSDARKPQVWARACALASDDHDEARFLYTNLRVEEMLNKGGKQRTFSPNRQRDDSDLADAGSDADNLDTLALTLDDGDEPAPSSRPAGLSNEDSSLEFSSTDEFEAEPMFEHSSVPGTKELSDEIVAFDDETMSEMDSLSSLNENTETVLSGLTGKPILRTATDLDSSDRPSTNDIVTDVFGSSVAATRAKIMSPEEQRTTELAHKLERQVQIMSESQPTLEDGTVPVLEHSEELDDTAPITAADHDASQTIRSDYADASMLDDTMDLEDELDTGEGRSFMVFSRGGVIKAIKRGVSWPALFFTFPWLLSKAMFGTALVYGCLWLVSIAGVVAAGTRWLEAGNAAALDIKLWTAAFAVLAFIGLIYLPFRYGNRWLAKRLENRGFEYEAAVSANNKRDAINRLFDFDEVAQ